MITAADESKYTVRVTRVQLYVTRAVAETILRMLRIGWRLSEDVTEVALVIAPERERTSGVFEVARAVEPAKPKRPWWRFWE